jgi:hypothetical protein
MDTSGKAFMEHWNWAAEKGLMNRNTAAGTRSACAQVMGAQEDWGNLDVRRLDVEDALTRFQNLRKKDFKPAVLNVYKRRFRLAVSSYLKYLDDPGGWKPRQNERSVSAVGSPRSSIESTVRHEMPQAGLVEYPFPLRDGQIARLVLPRNLKTPEVKRLNAFMLALVVDDDVSPRLSQAR